MRQRFCIACLAIAAVPSLFAQKRPFDVETLLRIQRIGEPALSPDGKQVAFTVATPDLATNSLPKQIYASPRDRRRPAPTHPRRHRQRTPPLVPRFAPDLFRLQPRRIVASLGHGRRRRAPAPDHAPRDRSQRRAGLARRQEARVPIQRLSRMRRRQRLQPAQPRRRRQSPLESPHLHLSALSPLDRMAAPAAASICWWPTPTAPKSAISRPAITTSRRSR